MVRWFKGIGLVLRGVSAAIRSRPWVFLAASLGVFALNVFVPPLLLSLVRKPVDFYTFNPWLKRLPEYLVSGDAPLGERLAFLSRMALFWFSADSSYGGTDWGYAVDTNDVIRFLVSAFLVGTYFALWFQRREQAAQCGWTAGRAGRNGGIAGALASVLGLSTGPCSVVGCGAPVIPVVGLAFAGLSSGTLAVMATVSRLATALVLIALTLAVAVLGWRAGAAAP